MKRILTLILLLSCIGLEAATIPGSDYKAVYVGRTLVEGNTVSFDWSGTTIRIRFSGTCLKLFCTQEGSDWFNVWVDKSPVAKEDSKFRTEPGEQTVTVCSSLRKGSHEVVIQKRTEGEQGCITVNGFETDGSFLAPGEPNLRNIEFIGDSYTCGYGTESAGREEPFRPEEENCNLAYAEIIGRYFEADVTLVSHSGRGIVRNYGDYDASDTMTKKYSQVFDQHRQEIGWDASESEYTPDIVVIYLGTNDFSTGKQPSIESWCSNYSALIGKVRRNYGELVPILCVASKASPMMHEYVKSAAEGCGFANVHWTSIQTDAHNDVSDLGASWHPNYSGHRKVASCMIPYISTLTGWDMPFKAVE